MGGQLGLNQSGTDSPGPGHASGYSNSKSSPTQIPGTTWTSKIDTGGQFYLAIKTDNTLWAWGNNQWGTLGQNSNVQYSSPVQVGSDTTWDHISSEGKVARATKTDGTMWGWGQGGDGQLGVNNITEYSSPIQVPGTDWYRTSGEGLSQKRI